MDNDLLIPISEVEGIGTHGEERLNEIGVLVIADLLRISPAEIHAAVPGTSLKMARSWCQMARFMQIPVVTNQWAEALVRGGVKTIRDLSTIGLDELEEIFRTTVDTKVVPFGPSPEQLLQMVRGATVLDHTASIAGTVFDHHGKPIESVTVRYGQDSTVTDEHGHFRLAGIQPAGRRPLAFSHYGYTSFEDDDPPVSMGHSGHIARVYRMQQREDSPGTNRMGLKGWKPFFGVVVLGLWGLLFGAGLLVATLPYRMHISILASAADVAATAEGVVKDATRVDDVARSIAAADTTLDSSKVPEDTKGALTGGDVAEHPEASISPASKTGESLETVSEEMKTSVRAHEGSIIVAWLIVLFCYTPTNVLFLAILAGILGSLACQANIDWRGRKDGKGSVSATDLRSPSIDCDLVNPWFSGMVRGLFVFLMLISGLLVLTDDPFSNLNATRYVRLAGVTSLVSFLVSLRGEFFGRFLQRAGKGTDKS